jgi:riboflavin synthase
MFTGIVERTGKIVSLLRPSDYGGQALGSGITQLIIDPGKSFETSIGDSVAVNGCCLTVTSNKVQLLAFDVSSETLAKTSLAALRESDEVNLERALRVGDRLGGHLVSGHVDGTGDITRVKKQPEGWEVAVTVPHEMGRYFVAKGSICVDGVSLTVNSLADADDHTTIELMLIPTTVSLTSLKFLAVGQKVNVEVDPIGKYLERLVAPRR